MLCSYTYTQMHQHSTRSFLPFISVTPAKKDVQFNSMLKASIYGPKTRTEILEEKWPFS